MTAITQLKQNNQLSPLSLSPFSFSLSLSLSLSLRRDMTAILERTLHQQHVISQSRDNASEGTSLSGTHFKTLERPFLLFVLELGPEVKATLTQVTVTQAWYATLRHPKMQPYIKFGIRSL